MKTRYILFTFLVGMSVFFASSCSLGGLEPFSGNRSDLPQVTMQFGQLASGSDGSVSRAIVQGDGFLYIRTLGGPTGSKGPLYGPYSVKAYTDFTTTDIPEGNYSSLMILYSSEVLDSTKLIAYNGGNYSVPALLSLPDADFKTFAGTDTSTSNALGDYFDGKVSYGEQKNVTLEMGKTTNLSMTLKPVTGSSSTIDLSKNISKLFSSSTPIKKFYRIDGLSVPAGKTLKSVMCNFIGHSGSTNKLAKVDFYDRNGKLLTRTETGTDLVSGKTYTMDEASSASIVDPSGYVELYMYLEYLGSITATYGYSGTGGTPVAPVAPVSAVAVGIILPNSTISRWNIDLSSMTAMLGAAGTSYECMYSNDDTATELVKAQALIAKGIKVLIIAPNESGNCPAAAAAKAAGVKVIAYDRLITGSNNVDYYITFDNFSVGVLQGLFLVTQALTAGGSGYPLLLYAGNYNDNNAHVFFQGAWSVLKPYILNGTFIVQNSPEAATLANASVLTEADITAIFHDPTTPIDTEWSSTTATSLANRDYSNNSASLMGLVFILAPNDSTARAISDVFLTHVNKANLFITGQDAEKASVQYILDGQQSMTVFKDVRLLGIGAADMAIDIIAGITPTTADVVNNGVIDVPVDLFPGIPVEKDDVQSILIDTGYYAHDDFLWP